MSRLVVLAILSLISLPLASYAQVLYGSLTGNVTDISAAPVPGAKVEVINKSNGVSRQTVSDDRGAYSFNDLQPGEYKITISSGSFSPFVREGIPVEAASLRRIDARLQVA